MLRLYLMAMLAISGCSTAEVESGLANEATDATQSDQGLKLLLESNAKLTVSRSEIEALLALRPSLFGYQTGVMLAPLKEAFDNLALTGANVDIQGRNLQITFAEAKAYTMSDDATVLKLAAKVVVSNWRKTSEEFYLFDVSGFNYGGQEIKTIRYSDSYGFELLQGDEYIAFDINPTLEFYDRHEKSIDTFMASIETPAAQSTAEMASDALLAFNWFSATNKTNEVQIKKDLLAPYQSQDGGRDMMTMVMNRIGTIAVRPGMITASMASGRGLIMNMDDRRVYLNATWSLIHEGPSSVRIHGLMVAQERIFRNDLWHPIYHARLNGHSMTMTAWVKPGALLKARNISSTVYL